MHTSPTTLLSGKLGIACYLIVAACGAAGIASEPLLFGRALQLASVNSGTINSCPYLSPDGKLLLFASRRPGGAGHDDLWMTTRKSSKAQWSDPQPLRGNGLNSAATETMPFLSTDGLSLFFTDEVWFDADVPHRPGGLGAGDIWFAKRANLDHRWSMPTNAGPLVNVNSSAQDGSPRLSADGLTLYLSSNRSGNHDLYAATRKSADDAFGPPTPLLGAVNSPFVEVEPSISSDGLKMFFASDRSGGGGHFGLWMATRDTVKSPWEEPIPLSSVNSPSVDATPHFSADGTSLLFLSRRDKDGIEDIWEAPVLPLEAVDISVHHPYKQDFTVLGTDPKDTAVTLPTGWIVTGNGTIAYNTITRRLISRPVGNGDVFNAGLDDDEDRALATGVSRTGNGNEIQLRTGIVGGSATQMRLQFDLEAWQTTSTAGSTGEGAFGVIAELDCGDGFSKILDLGTISTGTFVVPEGRVINGNDPAFQTKYDSGWQNVVLPNDATVRLRWITDTERETAGWVFGLDNVVLHLANPR